MGKDTLSGLKVSHAMRRQIISLRPQDSIDCCIRYLIKYKINAVLISEDDERPVGVVSKSDIMGAWYAGLALSTPAKMIMNGPVILCSPDDGLDHALDIMRTNHIYRLYVLEKNTGTITGALAYPDIVGLLYHYCSRCDRAVFNRNQNSGKDRIKRHRVNEIMTKKVESCHERDSLESVLQILSGSRFGAILITDSRHLPCGVISKTDVTLCYRHGRSPSIPASAVMSQPVVTCHAQDPVESAIKTMILKDLHRLFVTGSKKQQIAGVVSLTDAARLRSGSCHACLTSRIRPEY